MPDIDGDDRDLGGVVDLHDRLRGARLPVGDDGEVRLLLRELLGAGDGLLRFELLIAVDDVDAEILGDPVDPLVDRDREGDRRPAFGEGEGQGLRRACAGSACTRPRHRRAPRHICRSRHRRSRACRSLGSSAPLMPPCGPGREARLRPGSRFPPKPTASRYGDGQQRSAVESRHPNAHPLTSPAG